MRLGLRGGLSARAGLICASLVVALIALLPAAARGGERVIAGTGTTPGSTEPRVDEDGDKVFEDLEQELDRAPAGAEVDVIVRLRSPATAGRVRELERRVGGFNVKDRFSVIDGFAASVSKSQVTALAGAAGVAAVEEDAKVRALNSSAQASFGVTKARSDLPSLDGDADGNPTAYSGGDMVAAVIDTGIDSSHPDLDEGKVIAFKDFVNGRSAPYDDEGHGTHVAGTIAGEGDTSNPDGQGAAPGAALVGVKVLNSSGSGTTSNVVAGIDWVVANRATYGIEAINLSLGTTGCGGDTSSDALAVNRANAAGIVVAVAAGNSGPGTCTVGTPGSASGALTAGAMADFGANGFKQAYFSSRGRTADGRIKPDVSAPGVSITSAAANSTGYDVMSGTSMATPFVAGTALLMLDAGPALTPADVKAKIKSTAIDWGRGGNYGSGAPPAGDDIDYGAGRLDAYAALVSAGAGLTDPPAMPAHELRQGSLSGSGAQVDHSINVTDTGFPIAATLIHPSIAGGSAASPDFDLYLFDPNGTQVAKAETARRQDELGFQPTVPGTYILRVRSFSGGGEYFVDISAGTAPDTGAPTVTAQTPADGATEIDRAANVSVGFSEQMDRAATEAAFSLVRTSDGSPVAGAFSWNGNTMTFNPSADLDAGTGYTATVRGGAGGARDLAGNPLAADASWSFASTAFTAVTGSPATATIEPGGGTLRAGNAARLGANDNSFYQVNSTTSGTRTSSWRGSFTGVSSGLRNLTVSYSGKNSRSCNQTVSAFRQTDDSWVQLDSRSVGSTEVSLSRLNPPGPAQDYVSGAGEVRVRVRCTRNSGSFYASGDYMQIAYERP
jgi:serine protease AprX